MVDIVGVNHALQIPASPRWPPGNPLVNNDVMEDEVEDSVAQDAQPASDEIGIVYDQGGVIKQSNGR
jgi:hypothetical protein